jgi:serine/threonine-protein kinase
MELVEGLPLSAVLRRRAAANQPIPLETIACIGIALCEALAYAHRLVGADGAPLHIVHRDVSPQNVMLSREGNVKLIDFGVARARTRELKTQVGLVRGKLAYAAPEQLRGEELDGRTDLFALGVVLYEMVTLERPFVGASEPAICSAILEGRRRPVLEVRDDAGALATIIDRALEMSRAERYGDAAALARALDEAFPHARSKTDLVRELLDSVGGAAPETARSRSVESTSAETESAAAGWEAAAETKLDHTRRARPAR